MTIVEKNTHMEREEETDILLGGECVNDQQYDEEDDNDDDDDDDEYCNKYFESIRSKTGLEIGCKVTWPNIVRNNESDNNKDNNDNIDIVLELSTCFKETAIAPIFDGTQWAGTRIWNAAIIALQYIIYQQQQQQSSSLLIIDETTTILELGCGLGVPGMILHSLYNCYTILTDKNDLLEQLCRNINTNFNTTTKNNEDEQESNKHNNSNNNNKIQAQALDWSVEGIHTLLQTIQLDKFDIVINCDCIYEPLYGDSWKYLLSCQEELLRIDPNTYMITCCERRKMDGINKYINAAKQSSIIERIELIQIPFDNYPKEIEIYRFYGKKRYIM